MRATTATRLDVERATHERPGVHRGERRTGLNCDHHGLPNGAAVVGRSVLAGMAACTATSLAQPELMTALQVTVAAVILGLSQIALGEQVIHDRPTLGWRTAFTIDLALMPTALAIWAAAEFEQWGVLVAAAALVTAWLCFALLWCARDRQDGATHGGKHVGTHRHVRRAVNGRRS